MLWNVVRAELLDDRRGLAVVAVVVGDVFGSNAPGTDGRCSLPAAAMAGVGFAGVAVVVAFTSPGVNVGAAKDAVPVEVEAAPMVPPLIRRAP